MWKLFFLAVIWSIWKERNRRCFEGKVANVNMVAEAVKRSVALWVSLLPQFKGISMPSIFQNWKETADSRPHSMRHTPRWIPPPPLGSLKLNFDGSACGSSVVGGIICNEEGTILLSFSGPAGFNSVNKAKLLALCIGFRQAPQFNPQYLFVEENSACVIWWASNSSNLPWHLADLIEGDRAVQSFEGLFPSYKAHGP